MAIVRMTSASPEIGDLASSTDVKVSMVYCIVVILASVADSSVFLDVKCSVATGVGLSV